MTPSQNMRVALLEAVEKANGQVAFAAEMSSPERLVSQQIVSYWIKRGTIPAELVLRTEKLTGVSRYRLRPDVFGDRPDQQSSHAA
ncbi:YdaS family helix-turn-helix protein [Pseudomonas syringae]|uniref:YdaS family helix-turn-helix protein n=1 Tax=Pseudomonas syringae TaxID=317 RepID=UPI001CA8B378|nr:YdaS family helix-turn-helix protein [Pseudomonas syringae]MCK9724224.1 helix-turn-helix domain-containing protein [Pseudomonas syringae pv. syringae]